LPWCPGRAAPRRCADRVVGRALATVPLPGLVVVAAGPGRRLKGPAAWPVVPRVGRLRALGTGPALAQPPGGGGGGRGGIGPELLLLAAAPGGGCGGGGRPELLAAGRGSAGRPLLFCWGTGPRGVRAGRSVPLARAFRVVVVVVGCLAHPVVAAVVGRLLGWLGWRRRRRLGWLVSRTWRWGWRRRRRWPSARRRAGVGVAAEVPEA
jgi:hypothetical protein